MTANPEATTAFIVVGDKMSIQVKNAIAAGKHNVVDYRWILECINRKSYDFPSTQHVSREREKRENRGGGGREG